MPRSPNAMSSKKSTWGNAPNGVGATPHPCATRAWHMPGGTEQPSWEEDHIRRVYLHTLPAAAKAAEIFLILLPS